VIHRDQSSYTQQALLRSSKILYNSGKYERALPYYKDLVELASDPNVLYNTYIGLMRTNYLLQNYVNAVNAAQEVLDNNLLDNERVKIEGNYILGMSNVQLERYNKALSY